MPGRPSGLVIHHQPVIFLGNGQVNNRHPATDVQQGPLAIGAGDAQQPAATLGLYCGGNRLKQGLGSVIQIAGRHTGPLQLATHHGAALLQAFYRPLLQTFTTQLFQPVVGNRTNGFFMSRVQGPLPALILRAGAWQLLGWCSGQTHHSLQQCRRTLPGLLLLSALLGLPNRGLWLIQDGPDTAQQGTAIRLTQALVLGDAQFRKQMQLLTGSRQGHI